MANTRTETDSFGPIEVPADAYWGAQTERSIENFPFGPRERMPSEEWLVCDMRTLDLGRRFDGLLAWHSFFHLCPDDQRAMFARFAAHAAPGAILMFTSGPAHGEAIGEWEGEPLYHDSLAQDEYRSLLAANDFEILRFTAGEPIAPGPSVWLARRTG